MATENGDLRALADYDALYIIWFGWHYHDSFFCWSMPISTSQFSFPNWCGELHYQIPDFQKFSVFGIVRGGPIFCWLALLADILMGKVELLLDEIYRVSQEEWTKLRESVPYVELYWYNPKHLYPKLNGYGGNGHRKVWASGVSTYCTPSVMPYSSTAHARQRHTAS